MIKYKFYDTCSLLLKAKTLFDDDEEQVIISSITLEELENIKISSNKDAETKYAARQLLHKIDDNTDKIIIHIFRESMLAPIAAADLTVTNDVKILATAIDYSKQNNDIIFITNDLALKAIAKIFFKSDMIDSIKEEIDGYKGFKEVYLEEKEMEYFYSNYKNTTEPIIPDIKINEYLVIKDKDTNEVLDRLLWTGNGYRNVSYETFDSRQFGRIKPIDLYQQLVADSFVHNKITLIRGKAGSGKSLLSLGFLFNQLEKQKIDKIIVFCNTVAAKNSARLGFYPGCRDEKLMDSQIGNMLASKLGSKIAVEQLINDEKLILLPFSDIRGYDTTGMRAGIYITEAQNLDIALMKLALQRIGDDSICIIDGDDNAQVDDIAFAGDNNGIRRVSKVFRGYDVYGEIELQIIHRSKIAEIAEKL